MPMRVFDLESDRSYIVVSITHTFASIAGEGAAPHRATGVPEHS